jgi:ABC-type phosphate transport system substrate-binding protein
MMRLWVVLLLLYSFFPSGIEGQLKVSVKDLITCDNCVLTPILGGGSFSSSDLFSLWILSYGLLQSHVEISFLSGTDDAIGSLLTECKSSFAYDYAIESFHPDVDANPEYFDLTAIPFFAQAVVISYHLPGINLTDSPINISREVLSRIYTREITTWDHPDLLALNDDPKIVPRMKGNITLIMRLDDTVCTETLLETLERIDPETWPQAETGLTVPARFNRSDPTLLWAKDQYAATSLQLNTVGALGYNPADFSVHGGLIFASIINRAGTPTRPDDHSLRAAVDTLDFSQPGRRESEDAEGNLSYPLTAMTFGIFHKTVEECHTYEAMLKFFHWCLTNPYALALDNAVPGFSSLPPSQVDYAVNVLLNFQCDDRYLLSVRYADEHVDVLEQIIMCISGIFMMLALTVLATLGYKRKSRVTKAAGLAFAVCFLVGCLSNYVAVFFWALAASTDDICMARYSLVLLGYSLILGAMFSKSWELNKVFRTGENDGLENPLQEIPWWRFCRVFLFIVGIQVILLITWYAVDPPKHFSTVLDPINWIGSHKCVVDNVSVWAALELVYFFFLLVWGAYLAYETKDVWAKYNYPNESRSILMSIYNLAFCGVILLPLMTSLDVTPETLFFLISISILWPTSFALFSVYFPKLAKFLSSTYRGSGRDSKGAPPKSTSAGSAGKSGTSEPHREEVKLLIDHPPKKKSTSKRAFEEPQSAESSPPMPQRTGPSGSPTHTTGDGSDHTPPLELRSLHGIERIEGLDNSRAVLLSTPTSLDVSSHT